MRHSWPSVCRLTDMYFNRHVFFSSLLLCLRASDKASLVLAKRWVPSRSHYSWPRGLPGDLASYSLTPILRDCLTMIRLSRGYRFLGLSRFCTLPMWRYRFLSSLRYCFSNSRGSSSSLAVRYFSSASSVVWARRSVSDLSAFAVRNSRTMA